MNGLSQAIWVEALKARRSKMPLFTALGFSLLPLVGGLLVLILKDPELARRMGLISAKAQLTMGTADWPTFLQFLHLGTAVAGIILFGLIISWVFGREYADRTIKDLLALPTGRATIVSAKFIVVGVWTTGLIILISVVGLAVGNLIDLPQVPTQVIWQGMGIQLVIYILSILVLTPIAFAACAGHGYLPPMSAALLCMALAQIIAVLGWGDYFPWAIPGVYAQGGGLEITSYSIVILTCAAGLAATYAWWELADQSY